MQHMTQEERYWDSRAQRARARGDWKEYERLRRMVVESQARRYRADRDRAVHGRR